MTTCTSGISGLTGGNCSREEYEEYQRMNQLHGYTTTDTDTRVDRRLSGRYALDEMEWFAGQRRTAYGQIQYGVWNRRSGLQVLICVTPTEASQQAALLNSFAAGGDGR